MAKQPVPLLRAGSRKSPEGVAETLGMKREATVPPLFQHVIDAENVLLWIE